MSEHQCELPRLRWRRRRFKCETCNANWVVVRYIKWKVWMTVRANGKVERR